MSNYELITAMQFPKHSLTKFMSTGVDQWNGSYKFHCSTTFHKNCDDCPLSDAEGYGCAITGRDLVSAMQYAWLETNYPELLI